jgi:hypothetical protein
LFNVFCSILISPLQAQKVIEEIESHPDLANKLILVWKR